MNYQTINQKVNGEVAYVAKETFSFGGDGNNNTFTLEEGADVNIRAGQEITFLPGFTAEAGSKLHAKIDPGIDYPDVLKSTIITPKPVIINHQNEYVSIVHDYSLGNSVDKFEFEDDFVSINMHEIEKDEKLYNETDFKLSLHPNPARDETIINVTGIKEGSSAIIKIYNPIGAIIYHETISSNGKHKFDISQLVSGNYYLQGEYKSEYKTVKFVKL